MGMVWRAAKRTNLTVGTWADKHTHTASVKCLPLTHALRSRRLSSADDWVSDWREVSRVTPTARASVLSVDAGMNSMTRATIHSSQRITSSAVSSYAPRRLFMSSMRMAERYVPPHTLRRPPALLCGSAATLFTARSQAPAEGDTDNRAPETLPLDRRSVGLRASYRRATATPPSYGAALGRD